MIILVLVSSFVISIGMFYVFEMLYETISSQYSLRFSKQQACKVFWGILALILFVANPYKCLFHAPGVAAVAMTHFSLCKFSHTRLSTRRLFNSIIPVLTQSAFDGRRKHDE